jgi:hypothetical protein
MDLLVEIRAAAAADNADAQPGMARQAKQELPGGRIERHILRPRGEAHEGSVKIQKERDRRGSAQPRRYQVPVFQ